jgi:hypothetical protein
MDKQNRQDRRQTRKDGRRSVHVDFDAADHLVLKVMAAQRGVPLAGLVADLAMAGAKGAA